MSFETQKNFVGKTQTIILAEVQSERWLSWIRLIIGGIYSVPAIFSALLGRTSQQAFLVQGIAIIALLSYSSYYLFHRTRRLSRIYFLYIMVTLDVAVITAILWSYHLNGAGFNFITSAIFGAYFVAIAFTSLHHKTSLSIYCGILSAIGFSILYYAFSTDTSLPSNFISDYTIRIGLLMTVAGLGAIVSRNNSRTIQQVVSSEIRYHNLVHRLPEMLFTLDSHGTFLWANSASHSILGIPSKILSGRNLRSFLVSPDLLKLEQSGIKGTFEIRDFNGNRKFVDCIIQGIEGESGSAAYEGIISDVTDRELAISQREEMVNRLFQFQKMESLGTLASGMAHDFNNILQTVNDITSMVEKESNEPETRRKMELVKESMADARFLISELFALGRKKPFDYKPINLNSFLETITQQFRNQLGPSYTLSMDLSSNPFWIQGDPDYLKRVFQNLIGNARDAMPGGGSIKVSCTGPEEGSGANNVIIRVSDSGSGISAELTEKIFDPFFTTKKPGKGTGLGLALARRIIMLHNGSICVEKSGPDGTVFKIQIPISDAEDLESDTRTLMLNKIHTSVLLLDDDPKIREVLKIFLLEFKYTILEASNSDQAVSRLQKHLKQCQIVVMDWKLGNEDPLQVIRRMREIKNDLIVIVVSGYAPDQKAIEMMNIHKWFTKPYDKNQLDIEIQRALHRNEPAK
ncbi:MAG: response regulator [Fibrobacter sp.]|nr:response regulator [Fibrobacter sp.]